MTEHCLLAAQPLPKPPEQLVEARVAELADPVLPVLQRPQLFRVLADLVVVAGLKEEDVARRVARRPAAARVVTEARADLVVAAARLEGTRRFGEAQHIFVLAALARQPPEDGARLPLDVPTQIVRDRVAKQAEDIDVGADAFLRMSMDLFFRVPNAVILNVLVKTE